MSCDRSRLHSKWTCREMECLSIPTFNAFVVMRAWNCPRQLCWLSQKIQICQNLSVLSRELLMFNTSTANFFMSSFFLSWLAIWSDCCLELQKMTTLQLEFCSGKFVTITNPLETKTAFFAHISNFISILRWQNSWGGPLRTQVSGVGITTLLFLKIGLYFVGNLSNFDKLLITNFVLACTYSNGLCLQQLRQHS